MIKSLNQSTFIINFKVCMIFFKIQRTIFYILKRIYDSLTFIIYLYMLLCIDNIITVVIIPYHLTYFVVFK